MEATFFWWNDDIGIWCGSVGAMYTFDFSGLYVTVMYESIKTFNSLLVSLVSCIHFILKLVSLIEIAIKGIGREREREREKES